MAGKARQRGWLAMAGGRGDDGPRMRALCVWGGKRRWQRLGGDLSRAPLVQSPARIVGLRRLAFEPMCCACICECALSAEAVSAGRRREECDADQAPTQLTGDESGQPGASEGVFQGCGLEPMALPIGPIAESVARG